MTAWEKSPHSRVDYDNRVGRRDGRECITNVRKRKTKEKGFRENGKRAVGSLTTGGPVIVETAWSFFPGRRRANKKTISEPNKT